MTTKYDKDRISAIALEAMKSMLGGLYSDAGMLAAFKDAADDKKISWHQSLAEQSYSLARTMLIQEHKTLTETKIE